MIYLDYAATTPMSEEALTVYQQAAKQYYGNSMSLHNIGTEAGDLLNKAREQIAKVLNVKEDGIYFTSGGSEANYLAIASLAKAHSHKGKHLITTQLEHKSVLNTFDLLKEEGFTVSYVSVDPFGRVDPSELQNLIQSGTILVSIGHGNGEIGTIQNIEKIGELLDQQGILFHSDCVQTFGKLPIDAAKAKLSSVSISSHKIYGPKGTGACYIDPLINWKAQIPNTTHEKGFRQGTVDVPAIAAFATAAAECDLNRQHETNRMYELRNLLISRIMESDLVIEIEADCEDVLPHIVGMRIRGMEGQYAMLEFNRLGVAVSTGSACKVGQHSPSKTLTAIGRTETEAHELVRLSLGKLTTKEDINQAFECLLKMYESYNVRSG
jgi:cysteine desulfurase